ncbi:hypothetical protein BU26DRAFT_159063 [Trematosphaeria pertusa]|uniref:Uncharacterized protein n=1 Tax=Trematosphaeria pertusa TaxID=390896 RepID=A0A6A6HYA8_9PLEO|nr:uncharacterized protein BU26DRAFT_159063 [Trematosphaeria pertusa]KAF2242350.1 hypothetical protein BU26DRAFT_159063 [Trematosphaeria pertusa]
MTPSEPDNCLTAPPPSHRPRWCHQADPLLIYSGSLAIIVGSVWLADSFRVRDPTEGRSNIFSLLIVRHCLRYCLHMYHSSHNPRRMRCFASRSIRQRAFYVVDFQYEGSPNRRHGYQMLSCINGTQLCETRLLWFYSQRHISVSVS